MLLEKGKAYFEIVFCLPENVVPEIESYILIGKNIFSDGKDSDEYYFQTPRSYYKHVTSLKRKTRWMRQSELSRDCFDARGYD